MSVCRMSGLKSRRMSSIGCARRMARDRHAGELAARRRRELAGALRRDLAHRRREHETDGVHFAGQRRAHRHRRGHAADLDERPARDIMRGLRSRARATRRRAPCASMARASCAGSAADMSALPTSARS